MPRLFKDHHSGIRLSTPDEMDHIRALIVQIIPASARLFPDQSGVELEAGKWDILPYSRAACQKS